MNNTIIIISIVLVVIVSFGLGMIFEAFLDNRTIIDLKNENADLKRIITSNRKNPEQKNINICEYPAEVRGLEFDPTIRAERKGFDG